MIDIRARAALTSGASFWSTEATPELPAVVLSDGPHGVRSQTDRDDHLGIAPSRQSTCFPPAAGLAQSWNEDLVVDVARALGREAKFFGIGVLLGPGVNIRRDPRCGRNFEYFSEDPLLAGVLGAGWVRGVQSEGVASSPKHFAVNNTETDRMRSDSRVDERALREIYLRVFQRVVVVGRPWTIMCSYNKINGTYAAENPWLLTQVLREEWGFDGTVLSDWASVPDRITAIAAGLDLAMPGGDTTSDDDVAQGVTSGVLSEADLDRAAANVIRLMQRVRTDHRPSPDFSAHHALARSAAAESIVLLRNEGNLLPLASGESLAVIGRFAKEPRYQGGGSSHVNPTQVECALDEIRLINGSGSVTFAPGWDATGQSSAESRHEAVRLARAATTAVLFLGLEEEQESEGFDREQIDLPSIQLDLLRAVAGAQPRTVVVLSHGGVVRLGEVARLTPAVLDGALLGQAGGGAVADVLFGLVNPSGRLAETVPARLADVPSYENFPGEHSHVIYGESIFVGYRWYDHRDMSVTFPFGHGLSYTTFAYGDVDATTSPSHLSVRVNVRNTGRRAGHDVVQFYVAKPESAVRRPPWELKAFRKVRLEPGESRAVDVAVALEDLAYWDERVQTWVVEPGRYTVAVGASSRDIRGTADVEIHVPVVAPPPSTASTLEELSSSSEGAALVRELLAESGLDRLFTNAADSLGPGVLRTMMEMPLDRLRIFTAGATGPDRMSKLIDAIDAARTNPPCRSDEVAED